MNVHCKTLLIIASIFGVVGIIMASIGAHSTDALLPSESLTNSFHKAVDYSQANSITLIAIALSCQLFSQPDFNSKFHWAGYCIALGGFIFQGSLFLYSLSGIKAVTAITPFGGMLLISGWLIIGIAALTISQTRA